MVEIERQITQQRLAKAIASGGICSRRQAEILIKAGVVNVDGKIVDSVSTIVSDDSEIRVYGELVNLVQVSRLWLYYKPIGLITTHRDPQNRNTIFNSLKGLPRVISIGRLDINSEGLLLLTNSGSLARSFELPINKIERIYRVRAYGNPKALLSPWSLIKNSSKKEIMVINGIKYSPKSIELISAGSANAWFEVILTEGKNREIRKIFEHFNLQVNRLIRVRFGSFSLDGLKPGEYREHIGPI